MDTDSSNNIAGSEDTDHCTTVYRVKIIHSSATETCICKEEMELIPGDKVIVPTRYGKELGCVLGICSGYNQETDELEQIERKACSEDIMRFSTFKQKEQSVFDTCRQKIKEHGLDMKLVSTHYLIDEAKILLYFTAEARVDFRDLVKDLVSVFKKRIELRQIGVRDEARVLGGIGVCGRYFCCHSVTDKLAPVSIKMAKEQNLTLNSMKISGPCGRLLCCLAYEYDLYKGIKENLPPEGTQISLDGVIFKVTDINMFTNMVKMQKASGESRESIGIEFSRFTYNSESGKWQVSN